MILQDYQTLSWRMQQLDLEREEIQRQIDEIRTACPHSKLPKRELGEEYMDTCPDCGYVQYCYSL